MKTKLIEKYAPPFYGATHPVVHDSRLLMDASGDVKSYYVNILRRRATHSRLISTKWHSQLAPFPERNLSSNIHQIL
jgi:hypothetical protein